VLTRTIKRKNLPLNGYCHNIYSQNGEDGVLSELLLRLGMNGNYQGSCVEFGAWDGKHLSNTYALVESGWNAVYIESDVERYKSLQQTARLYPRITPINRLVECESWSINTIDQILSETPIEKFFDILSIDIDSYDLKVWQSMQIYQPKIVVIEINSSFRTGLKRNHNYRGTQGNSFASTLETGLSKGYQLVCHTGNLIFVKDELFPLVRLPRHFSEYPELLFVNYFLSQKDRLFDYLTPNRKIMLCKIRVFLKDLKKKNSKGTDSE
jgi:hypothetical protein